MASSRNDNDSQAQAAEPSRLGGQEQPAAHQHPEGQESAPQPAAEQVGSAQTSETEAPTETTDPTAPATDAAAPATAATTANADGGSQRKTMWVRLPAFRIAFTGMLGAGLGWWLLHGINTIGTVLTYVGLAVFLALGLEPVVRFLERRKVRRGLAVVIVAAAFVVLVAGVLVLIVPTVVDQTQDFIGNLPNLINEIAHQQWVKDLEHSFSGALDVDKIVDSASSWASDPANLLSVGGGIVTVGSAIATGTTGIIIVVILTVYFSITLPRIKDWAYALVPASKRQSTESVAEEIMTSVGGYVLGQIALAGINGVLSAIFLLILGAPLPALLALVAFLGSMIPLVGTLSASVVIVLSCLFVSPSMAIVAAIYYLVYMQVEAYGLSPRIMRAAVNVPGALVIIGAVAGATIAGVLGAIVAVPVTASLIIIVRRVVIPIQAAK